MLCVCDVFVFGPEITINNPPSRAKLMGPELQNSLGGWLRLSR